jgi:hypothetical protein
LNTNFFHASTVCRRRYNSQTFIKAYNGAVLNSRENIGAYIVDHFSKLFTSMSPILDDSLSDLFKPVITDEENSDLCNILDEREIYDAIVSLGLNKALGLDGMAGLFYKSY